MDAVIADLVNPEHAFGHLGYILIIASMMMTSLRRLRILALLSGIAAMIHFMFVTSDTVSFVWEVIFTVTNGTQLAVLLYNSRKLRLTEAERKLVYDVLDMKDSSDQRALLAQIEWRDIPAEKVLIAQNAVAPPLIYIAEGAAGIEHDGRLVGICGHGDFLGEMSMISGNPASATVRAANVMHVGRFNPEGLRDLFASSPTARSAVTEAFNRGLAARVLRMNRDSA